MDDIAELDNGERMKNRYKVSEIDPLGYGNPEAKISYKNSLENLENGHEVVEAVSR